MQGQQVASNPQAAQNQQIVAGVTVSSNTVILKMNDIQQLSTVGKCFYPISS